jgi:L-rhamnonate dehydratase
MKIKVIETFPLGGRVDRGTYGFVVKVVASDGSTGYGEADTLPAGADAIIWAPAYHETMSGLASILIGSDPREIEVLWDRMVTATLSFGRGGIARHAMAAIDIALWDLKGKLLGKPVCELIGGQRRDRLPVYASHALGANLAETEAFAAELVATGSRAVKFGWPPLGPDPHLDESIVRTLRTAVGPDVSLLIDGGMAWTIEQAIDRSRRFAPFDLHWLEEPLAPYDFKAYSQLRRASTIRIAAGELAASGAELIGLIESGGVDFLQIDISRVGLTEAVRVARRAAEHGVRIVNHTFSHILNTAASLQLAASVENVGMFEHPAGPNEIRDALAGKQLRPNQGWIDVPFAAGLGVSVNEDVLREFRLDRVDPATDGSQSAVR